MLCTGQRQRDFVQTGRSVTRVSSFPHVGISSGWLALRARVSNFSRPSRYQAACSQGKSLQTSPPPPPPTHPALLVHSQAEKCWYQTAQAVLLRDPSCQESFHGSLFPSPMLTIEGRRGLKDSQTVCVCVCVCTRAAVYLYLFLFFFDTLWFHCFHLGVWCQLSRWQMWMCLLSFQFVFFGEENTRKIYHKHSRLPRVMTHSLVQDCLCI